VQGVEARTRQVVWNRDDNRVKLICLCKKSSRIDSSMPQGIPSAGSDSDSDAAVNGAAAAQATGVS
jgi:hypothetical protein